MHGVESSCPIFCHSFTVRLLHTSANPTRETSYRSRNRTFLYLRFWPGWQGECFASPTNQCMKISFPCPPCVSALSATTVPFGRAVPSPISIETESSLHRLVFGPFPFFLPRDSDWPNRGHPVFWVPRKESVCFPLRPRHNRGENWKIKILLSASWIAHRDWLRLLEYVQQSFIASSTCCFGVDVKGSHLVLARKG